MKTYLIYPDVASFHGLPYSPGLASIAATMVSKGHDVKVAYFNKLEQMNDILSDLHYFKPDLIGFTSVETQFVYVKQLASKIKSAHKCPVICGGSYVTLYPEVLMEDDVAIDALIVGEGEYAVSELTDRLDKGENWLATKNLVYKDLLTNKLVKNPLNALVENLDSLPFPSTELFPYQDLIDRENLAMFHFNRGCPYMCSFCSNKALGRVYGMPSNRIRYRSVASVIDEISRTLSKYKLRHDTILHIVDDLFIFDKKWLVEFCDAYKEKIHRPFWCTGRSNHITGDICAALKSAGCVALMMSVESGNDFVRNEVMLRNISRKTLFESFDICDKYGINVLATCIIGLPHETPKMIEESIETMAKLKSITSYGINIFYPYKGTRLREICEEKHLISPAVGRDFLERKESILILPDLPQETILYYYKNWVKLIMKHKGIREELKYFMRNHWDNFRKTPLGKKTRNVINDTGPGRAFKKFAMKHIWNRR